MPSDGRNRYLLGELGEEFKNLGIGLRFGWFGDDVGVEEVAYGLPLRHGGDRSAIANVAPNFIGINVETFDGYSLTKGGDRAGDRGLRGKRFGELARRRVE
jgi:hypothetical protein